MCELHQTTWRHPVSAVERRTDITFYEHLAQTAEAGLFDATAHNHSMGGMPPSVERYARAFEFLDAVAAPWDSWADDTNLHSIAAARRTARHLLGRLAAGRGHCTAVGTPKQVADGFNWMPPLLPGSVKELIDQVVSILQRRSLSRTEYAASTLCGHLGLERPIV